MRILRAEHLGMCFGVRDAISLARENAIPILVFSIYKPGAFADVLAGKGCFTLVRNEG